MDYKGLLEHSFLTDAQIFDCKPRSRLIYLADHIFDFTTDDGEMSKLFATKALEVCRAITLRTTFEYIKEPENYRWFLLMCNMPFFSQRIDYGTSVRGSWWSSTSGYELLSCGLWVVNDQVRGPLRFTDESWKEFTSAMSDFVACEKVA